MPESDFPVLEMRRDEVALERENFNRFVLELELLDEETEYGTIRTQFDESYFSCYSKSASLLKSAIATTYSLASSRFLNNLENLPLENISTAQPPKGKLPSLSIQPFSRSYDTWLGFRDLFKSLVADNKTITNIEKFCYLKGCLTGEAAEVIDSIELSAESYSV